MIKPVFLKLWWSDHWWSAAVCEVVWGSLQAVLKEALQKLYQTLNKWNIRTYMSVLKLPLLVDLQQVVRELVLSITSCHSIIILENALNKCTEKCGYGNFNHWYNVSPIHLHALLCAGNLTKVDSVWAYCLWSGLWLPTVWETLL
jgi:hypothetical protein